MVTSVGFCVSVNLVTNQAHSQSRREEGIRATMKEINGKSRLIHEIDPLITTANQLIIMIGSKEIMI